MLGFHQAGELGHRDVGAGVDNRDQIVPKRRQPPARRPPLAGRIESAGLVIAAHQFYNKARRDIELARCGPAGLTRLDTGHDPAAKVQ